jgi:HSP20 family protein
MANLTRYSPFQQAVSLRDAMNRLFEDSFISPGNWAQWAGGGVTANLYETPGGFILEVPIPGVKPEDVEITTQQDTVTLKWERKMTAPEGATAHWNSFQAGQFQETFTLPAPINADRAEASTANGVLTLNLPKTEHAKARTLKVTAK